MSRSTRISKISLVFGVLLLAHGCGRNGSPTVDAGDDNADSNAVVVTLATAERRDVVRRFDTIASLDPWERATVYAKVSGYLATLEVDRGDRVEAGAVIATLEIPEMANRKRKLDADARLATVTLARLESIRREEKLAVTQQEIDEAAAKQASAVAELNELEDQEAYARILAPFDGRVSERFCDPGSLVTAGTQSKPTPLVTIVSTGRLRAVVDIPESEVRFLRIGSKASLTIDAMPGRTFAAEVSRFAAALDPDSRTLWTELLVPNVDESLMPGMFGRVSIDLETHPDALVIDPIWLRMQKNQAYLWTVVDGRAHRVDVQIGGDEGDAVEVRSGLDGDEILIASAGGPLAEGTRIRPKRQDGDSLQVPHR